MIRSSEMVNDLLRSKSQQATGPGQARVVGSESSTLSLKLLLMDELGKSECSVGNRVRLSTRIRKPTVPTALGFETISKPALDGLEDRNSFLVIFVHTADNTWPSIMHVPDLQKNLWNHTSRQVSVAQARYLIFLRVLQGPFPKTLWF